MIQRPDPLTRRLLAGSVPHGSLVLMYHSVIPGQGTPSWQWAVSTVRFIAPLDLLQAKGSTSASLADEVPTQPILSAELLRIMHAASMKIDSHTVSHCRLPRASTATVTDRQELEHVLSQPVTSFAYPYGQFDDEAVTAAREAGYQTVCTTRSGWALRDGDPLRIRRISIFAGDTLSIFARKLVFADNDISWRHLAKHYAGRLPNQLHLF